MPPADASDGYRQAKQELKDLLVKTKHLTPEGRLIVAMTWAGNNMRDINDMTSQAACRACREDTGPCVCLHDCGALVCTYAPVPCRCGHGTRMHECRQRANGSRCNWCGCPG
jgi:hypothetical protein